MHYQRGEVVLLPLYFPNISSKYMMNDYFSFSIIMKGKGNVKYMKKYYSKNSMEALKEISKYQVTLVLAPPGFGKTAAVKQYFNRSGDGYIWIDLKKKTLEELSTSDIKKNQYVILDHLKREHFNEGIISNFVQNNTDTHIILIYSDEAPSFFLKEIEATEVKVIGTIYFHFNIRDIKRLTKLNKIRISEDDIYKVYEYSGGWIKGIIILLENYVIFKAVKITDQYKNMIQQDIFIKLEESMQITLCYLSDIKSIHVDMLLYFEQPKKVLKLLKNLSSIGWLASYDEQRNVYSLTTPFKAFLAEKVIEFNLDLMQIYQRFAQTYERKKDYLEAIRFYEKIGDFDKIVTLIESYPNANFTDYDAELMKLVYDGLSDHILLKHPYVYLQMIHDHLSTFHAQIHGAELLKRFTALLEKGYYSKQDTVKYQGEVYLIKGYCAYNDVKQMCYYFSKAYDLLSPGISRLANNKMIITYGSPHILFLYHRQTGKMKDIANVFYQNISQYYAITEFSGVGIAQEAEAEYYLERGMYKEAESLALEAYYKAKDFSQNCIAVASLLTIGRCSLMTYKKDMFLYAVDALKTEKEKAVVELLKGEIDCALAYLYGLNNDLNQVADWLIIGTRQYLMNEANSYIYVVYGMILVKQKQYFRLKVIADILAKVHVHQKHIFGDIYALLYKTIAYENLGESDEAKRNFKELVKTAEGDMIIMPLIEFSDYLEPFIQTGGKSAYIKLLKSKIKEKQFRWRTSVFTEREQEIILYINAGFTRKKTAEMLKLRESTVATFMKRIYKKANVNDKEELKDFCNKL